MHAAVVALSEHYNAVLADRLTRTFGLGWEAVSGDETGTRPWIEQLIEKGDGRFTLLEATLEDLVKLLPDVPLREDRDAHAERVSGGSARF